MHKKGLIIGKFYPYHSGHEYLINEASKQCEELIVLLCSLSNESIPGDIRQKWMEESTPKNVKIIHIFDENPASPKDDYDDRFWNIWISTIKRFVDDIDVIFTSEEYGTELTDRLNKTGVFKGKIDHVCVDQARKRVPVSGTKLRSNPLKYWSFIPDVAKSYFVKRIAIVGPESTGKSTLAEQLAKEFKTVFVPEYGREYTDNNQLDLYGISKIALQQILTEDELSKKADKLLFCDTELITTQIWSEMYFQTYPEWIFQLNHTRKYDLFLLLNTDIPWVDDGTRIFPEMRTEHFKRIREELYKRNYNYKIISGDGQKRLDNAIAVIYEQFFDF